MQTLSHRGSHRHGKALTQALIASMLARCRRLGRPLTQMCGMVHAIHKNAVAPRIELAGPFIALPGGTARQLGGFVIGSVWSKAFLSCTQCKISTGRA